jgi:transposase
MGQQGIPGLLVIGATALRSASRRDKPAGANVGAQTIPVVPVALANKTARGIWAMLTRGESYRCLVLIDT